MIKMTIQDAEETAEFKVLEKPIIQKPLIAESDVVTIDNNLSTYVTGTQKRELTVGLGYLDSVGYETLRRIRDRQYAVLKYPTVTITADEPVDLGYGEDVPDYRQRLLQLKGKNLFDKDSVEYLVGYPTGTTIVSNTYHRTIYIPCEPNTTYTVQKINQGDNKRFALATTSVLPDIDVAVLQFTQDNNADSLTITTDNTANYLLVWCWVTNDTGVTWSDIIGTLQIEKGSTASSYAPYFTPIELCKIGTYQDKIYKSGDKWYLHKEIGVKHFSDVGSFVFSNGCFQTNYKFPDDKLSGTTAFSSYFTFNGTQPSITSRLANGEFGWNTSEYLTAKNTALTSKADWGTWLSSNNPSIYYKLATPTDTEITNETLIAQLDALQSSAFDRWTGVETEVQESSLQPYLTVTQGEITGSGKEVMLDGTTEDLLDFVILGDTYQQTYSGKNLANYIPDTTLSSGVSLSVDNNGVYTLNGTCSANSTFSIALPTTLAIGTSRTMSFNVISGTQSGGGIRYRIRNSAGVYSGVPDIAEIVVNASSTGRLTQTITNELATINIWVANGTVCSNYKFTVQLETGTTATDFEPYVGGTASPNPNYPQDVQTVNGDITFDFSGPSGVKKYTMIGKMTLADQRIIDNCGTNEQVQVSFRESKQL